MLLFQAMTSSWATQCVDYDDPVEIVEFDAGVEASGLAPSILRPGVFFTHGDMQDPEMVVSFDADGEIEEHDIGHSENHDWEDIASAPCPDPLDGPACLFIGDIGHNGDPTRHSVTIYVVVEPAAGDNHIDPVATWEAELPEDGMDSETLLVHPITGEVSLVVKDGDGEVLRLNADHTEFEEIGEDADISYPSGGAWDRTGERLAVRDGGTLYVWDTDPADPDGHWHDDPIKIDQGGGHGEGVTFGMDGELYGLGAEEPLIDDLYPCIPADDPEDDPQDEDDPQYVERSGQPGRLQVATMSRVAGCTSDSSDAGGLFGGVLILALGRRSRASRRSGQLSAVSDQLGQTSVSRVWRASSRGVSQSRSDRTSVGRGEGSVADGP